MVWVPWESWVIAPVRATELCSCICVALLQFTDVLPCTVLCSLWKPCEGSQADIFICSVFLWRKLKLRKNVRNCPGWAWNLAHWIHRQGLSPLDYPSVPSGYRGFAVIIPQVEVLSRSEAFIAQMSMDCDSGVFIKIVQNLIFQKGVHYYRRENYDLFLIHFLLIWVFPYILVFCLRVLVSLLSNFKNYRAESWKECFCSRIPQPANLWRADLFLPSGGWEI